MQSFRRNTSRELDLRGDELKHPEYLQEAYDAGKEFALVLGD